MTIQQIEFFLCVAKHLSFTRASEELLTTQPTVSRQICLMETELGFPLFTRTKRSVRLTAQGETLYEGLRKIPSAIDTAVQRARSMSGGSFSIGMLEDMTFQPCVEERISHFGRAWPQTVLTVRRRYFHELREGLMSGKFDLIVTLDFDIPYLRGVEYCHIYDTTSVVALSCEHPLAKKKDLCVADLADETFLLPADADAPGRADDVKRILSYYGVTGRLHFAPSRNTASTLLAIQAGKGVALLDRGVTALGSDRFVCLGLPQDKAPLSMVYIWRSDNANPMLHAFLDMKGS